MKQIQLIIKKTELDSEQIKRYEVRFPNQNNRLWLKAWYWYPFKLTVGLVVTFT